MRRGAPPRGVSSSISSSLVGALTNSSLTGSALSAIIGTEFVHGTNAPSLSPIVPVVHVVPPLSGDMCAAISDQRDFDPCPTVPLPDLKIVLSVVE